MKTTTSIKIDTELWKKAKIIAVQRNLTASELIEKLLKKEVATNE